MLAIIYGSSTDSTREAAEAIAAALRRHADTPLDLIDVATLKGDLHPLLRYDTLILGCPTWNVGQLQDDWDDAFPQLGQLDFRGKTVALFGCGDQQAYPDSFQDAMGIIGRAVRDRGATIVGRWPIADYEFYESLGVEDQQFLGLALDHDNDARGGEGDPRERDGRRDDQR